MLAKVTELREEGERERERRRNGEEEVEGESVSEKRITRCTG